MADEWIQLYEHAGHKVVLRLSELTGIHPDNCLAMLIDWLRFVDQSCLSSESGIGVDALDRTVGASQSERKATKLSFSEALCRLDPPFVSIGADQTVIIKGYEKRFSASAKRRCAAAARMKKSRMLRNDEQERNESATPSNCNSDSGGTGKEGKPPREGGVTWATPLFEVWRQAYGEDLPASAMKPLRGLVKKHGGEEAAKRLRNYLAETGANFLNIPKFVSTSGAYDGSRNGQANAGSKPPRGSAADRAREQREHRASREYPEPDRPPPILRLDEP